MRASRVLSESFSPLVFASYERYLRVRFRSFAIQLELFAVVICCRLFPSSEGFKEARDVLDNLQGLIPADVPPHARLP